MRGDDAMKKLASVLLCVSVCITIAALCPRHATCEETVEICNCETGVLDLVTTSAATETTATFSELIEECVADAEKSKDFKKCVSNLTKTWNQDGLIDNQQSRTIKRCSKTFKPVKTVKFVDVAQYLGLWYQIASYISPFIGELAAVTAEYSLNPDGTVKVVNKGISGGLDGTPVMIEGVARVEDEETNAKLLVSFPDFGITDESEYWIIELGEDYSYAVVTDSVRGSLFILSRTPTMDEVFYQDLVYRLVMQCFVPEEIVRTLQPED
jgi:apolipoprotein D and lipocalin family protein